MKNKFCRVIILDYINSLDFRCTKLVIKLSQNTVNFDKTLIQIQ